MADPHAPLVARPHPDPRDVTVDRQVETDLLDDAAVAAAVRAALAHGGRAGLRVGVVLVDDPTLALLHEQWLGDPSPTDVLAFDLSGGTPDEAGPQGEIYVSVDCARRVARELCGDPARELALYLVHGALHLCGHDDHEPSERARMRAAEAELLAELGYAPGPAVD
jgi:probable rRNA maturation factor